MKHNGRDKFDDLIDAALSSYADVEPLSGLEVRVLRRVQLAKDRRRRFVPLKWALALTTLASLLLVGVNLSKNHESPALNTGDIARSKGVPATIPPARSPEPSAKMPQVSPWLGSSPARTKSLISKSLPKQEQFPIPGPMTEGERALLAFVERDPEHALEAFRDLQNRSNDEIKIPEIVITPLPKSDGVE